MKNIEVKEYNNNARPEYKYRVFFSDGEKKSYRVFKTHSAACDFVKLLENKGSSELLKNSQKESLASCAISKTNITKLRAIDAITSEYDTSIEEILAFYVKHNSRLSNRTLTLPKAIASYYSYLKKADFTNKHKEAIVNFLNRFENNFKAYKLADLTTEVIKKWLDSLKVYKTITFGKLIATNNPLAADTYNNYRKYLQAFFNFCIKNKMINTNPINDIDTKKKKEEDIAIYNNNQVKEMIEKADYNMLKFYLGLALYTGIRKDELFRLRYEDIHIDTKDIILSAAITKTRQRRIVKLPENLVSYIIDLKLLENKKGVIFAESMRQRLKRFSKKLSFKWIKNGLRHTAASNYLALTNNEYETARQLGHSVVILKTHYAGLIRACEAKEYYNIVLS